MQTLLLPGMVFYTRCFYLPLKEGFMFLKSDFKPLSYILSISRKCYKYIFSLSTFLVMDQHCKIGCATENRLNIEIFFVIVTILLNSTQLLN